MTSQGKKSFAVKLADETFRSAFEAADAAGRQALLDQAGLTITLQDAEDIFQEMGDEISEDELGKAVGGGAGIIRPPRP